MAQRYQREIEEILDKKNEEAGKAGKGNSSGPRSQSKTKRARQPRSGPRFALRVTPGNLALGGVVLLLAALIFGLQPLLWVGIALFVIAYLTYFTKPRRTGERRWRGEIIDDPPQPGAIQRLWGWIFRG